MATDRYYLTGPTRDRLLSLVADAGDTGRGRARAGRGPATVLVRCTSATAAGAGAVEAQCYPGVVVEADAGAASWPDGGAVWLTLMDGTGAGVPTAGKTYVCVLSGLVAAGGSERPRAFAGSPAAAGGANYFAYATATLTATAETELGIPAGTPDVPAGAYDVTLTAEFTSAVPSGERRYVYAGVRASGGGSLLYAQGGAMDPGPTVPSVFETAAGAWRVTWPGGQPRLTGGCRREGTALAVSFSYLVFARVLFRGV